MSNIIINSFDGSIYTPLLPNANQAVFANNSQNTVYATTANNSQQLGGIDSTMYATKKYVDENFAKSIMGSYTGDGGYERNNVITYEEKPKFILISGTKYNPNYCGCAMLFADNRYCLAYGMNNGVIDIRNVDCSWNESNLGFNASSLLNFSDVIYNYIMIY